MTVEPDEALERAITERLVTLQEKLRAAERRAGRPSGSARLLAVSKRQPPEAIVAAHRAGQREFGENYPQELRDKARLLDGLEGLVWHAIGQLQTNKARYVARSASAFHALDRLEVAAALSSRREGPPLRCFIEVNVAGEASKAGVAPERVEPLLDAVRRLPGLEVVGLMTMPPLSPAPEAGRPTFRALGELAERLGLAELSMGTTADFEVAVEEGATVVRVGSALFGTRPGR